jgi:hypothetical protein
MGLLVRLFKLTQQGVFQFHESGISSNGSIILNTTPLIAMIQRTGLVSFATQTLKINQAAQTGIRQGHLALDSS